MIYTYISTCASASMHYARFYICPKEAYHTNVLVHIEYEYVCAGHVGIIFAQLSAIVDISVIWSD